MGVEQLKHVKRGDRPSASQQNIIVDELRKRANRDGRQYKYQQIAPDKVRVQDQWVAYQVYQIDDILSVQRRGIAYSLKTVNPSNSDNYDVLICDGAENWASFGFRPIMAKITGSFPAIGGMIGPCHGETTLLPNYPGFRFLGETDVDNVGWVIRDRGIATGEGSIITSSGQAGQPEFFELESVKFSSGFDGWDHTTDLTVTNSFSDEAEAGLLVQFKWDAYTGAYVSTDVECA